MNGAVTFSILTYYYAVIPPCVAHFKHAVRKLPDGFLLGVSSASYQVEGAWNADGKTENIYDYLTHTKRCYAKDCSNGDVAANSYYMYKRDVEMLRELGVDFYRFSLSWTRILPTSFPDKINEAGVEYYNNLIDELLKYNIQPVVTIYHWDLPQRLQDLGGWVNPHIVEWFADYARVVFNLFGDRVKYWITINEPYQICHFGYGVSFLAPGLNLTGQADYICSKNLLIAHANAYHIYDQEFRYKLGGTIFISINTEWYEPASFEDIEAAHDFNEFVWEQYANPIFSDTGDFPEAMKERIAFMSHKQGLQRSRLPEMSYEEILYIRGTSDIFGINHYSTYYAYRNATTYDYYENITGPSLEADSGVMIFQPREWQIGKSSTTLYAPKGFYNLLTYIRNKYKNVPVLITENGFATYLNLIDDDRVIYYRGYISAMLDAIDEGSNIIGYSAWSLMDNFEWDKGYMERFGLYEVDFNDTSRSRSPRKSAYIYKEIIRSRTLDMGYQPDMSKQMSLDDNY